MKWIRPLFYLCVLIFLAVSIEMKKDIITKKREAPVESVLSLMGENGLPLKVFNVERKEFAKQSLYHITPCSRNSLYCLEVSALEASSIDVGNKVRDPDSDKSIGEVSSISNNPASATGLYSVRLRLNEVQKEKKKLVKIDTLTQKQAIVVPIEALNQVKDEAFVFLLKEGQPKQVKVQVSEISNDEVLIESGLKEGDVLIVEGLSLLELFDKYQVVGEFKKLQKREKQ